MPHTFCCALGSKSWRTHSWVPRRDPSRRNTPLSSENFGRLSVVLPYARLPPSSPPPLSRRQVVLCGLPGSIQRGIELSHADLRAHLIMTKHVHLLLLPRVAPCRRLHRKQPGEGRVGGSSGGLPLVKCRWTGARRRDKSRRGTLRACATSSAPTAPLAPVLPSWFASGADLPPPRSRPPASGGPSRAS